MEDANLISKLIIIIDADENQLKKQKTYQTNILHIYKQANLVEKIFNYIEIVYYRRLFTLARYSNMPYIELKKIFQNNFS